MHLIINEIPLVRLPSPVVCNESSGQGDDAFSQHHATRQSWSRLRCLLATQLEAAEQTVS